MQGEKNPKKWHENIFGNKICKHSQNFVEGSSKPSKFKDGSDVSLGNLHQEAQLSKVCFSSQEHLIHHSYSLSYLPLAW